MGDGDEFLARHARRESIRIDMARYPEEDHIKESETVEETRKRIEKRWSEAKKCSG